MISNCHIDNVVDFSFFFFCKTLNILYFLEQFFIHYHIIAVGYTARLLEYIEENSELFADPSNVIDFILNLAPHQSNSIDSPNGVDAYSIDRDYDMLSGDDMGGLTAAFKTNSENGKFGESHRIRSFNNDLKSFMEAFTESNGDNNKLLDGFIKKMKEYDIKVTVKN